jgi:hypothetical protein
MGSIHVSISPGFLSGAGFPGEYGTLLQSGSRTPEELLRFSEAALISLQRVSEIVK